MQKDIWLIFQWLKEVIYPVYLSRIYDWKNEGKKINAVSNIMTSKNSWNITKLILLRRCQNDTNWNGAHAVMCLVYQSVSLHMNPQYGPPHWHVSCKLSTWPQPGLWQVRWPRIWMSISAFGRQNGSKTTQKENSIRNYFEKFPQK